MGKPGGQSLDREPAGLKDAVPNAETSDSTHVLVQIFLGALAPEHRDDVFRDQLALANGVLGVGYAKAAHSPAAEVGYGAHVAGAPGVFDDVVFGANTQVGAYLETTPLFDRQVGVAHDTGVRHDAGGPHNEVGFEALSGGKLNLAIDRRGQLRVEVNLCSPLCQVFDNPVAGRQGYLWHDTAHRLNEVKVGVFETDLRV